MLKRLVPRATSISISYHYQVQTGHRHKKREKRGAVRWVLHSVTGHKHQKDDSYWLKYTYFSDVSYFSIGWILIYISDVTHVEVHGLVVVVVVLSCHLVHSCRILSCVFVSCKQDESTGCHCFRLSGSAR